ncbi:sigma-70 family RNA polymerase sigma factor [Puniceicoccus vermicola]|uniref:Sigma-70 family RNA polymerase sigma factor n=1 Tax=Puniceicoccus vermicola TaxID=388746 RepID=A0A7X1B435_9BACT|nr:sigma-70 family RNA polymerase sigma factor [Puniceicoccus vermicola]
MVSDRSTAAAAGVQTGKVGLADSDARLIESVRSGNIAAFDQLVNKYKQRIFAIIYNMTSNREDAADLTQDCFIKAFRSLDRFKGRSHFFTWLYRIAVNATLSHIKRNRYRRFFSFENLNEEGVSPDLAEALASKMQTERPVMLGELQEKLNEALQSLSPKHRTVVVLFEIEGLSHEEISEVLHTSVGTVRSRLHYAKRQLQASLQPYLG